MDNGNHNVTTVQPSVMKYRKLLSRKSYFGLKNSDIAKAVGVCEKTVSVFLNGDDAVRPEIQDAIARVLRMRRVIDFEPIEISRDFAETVAGSGVKFRARYEMGRNCWVIIQEAPLGAHEVGAFHGLGSERMAKFCAERLNDAVGAK
jgi:hypothetical protein